MSGARVPSGRNCVRKAYVSEGTNRRASIRFQSHLRGVVLAVLAAGLLLIGTVGLVRPVPARAATTTATAQTASARRTTVSRAVRLRLAAWNWARRQQFKPYIYGGTGPAGFDCSGLVYAAYRSIGVILPRTTYGMLASRRLIRIPKWEARRGDLAFFGSGHVELYRYGRWTFGAEHTGTLIGFHPMNAFWHPTMYFRVRL